MDKQINTYTPHPGDELADCQRLACLVGYAVMVILEQDEDLSACSVFDYVIDLIDDKLEFVVSCRRGDLILLTTNMLEKIKECRSLLSLFRISCVDIGCSEERVLKGLLLLADRISDILGNIQQDIDEYEVAG